MEISARYRLMGAFTLAAIIGIFALAYWLNHAGGVGQRSTYQIRFLGGVPGLRPGATVQFNGIRVGEVTDIQLNERTPQQVMATISIDGATPVRRDTQVSLDFQGLMGVTSIALKGGAADSPLPEGTPPLLVADASAGTDLTSAVKESLRGLNDILSENAAPLNSTISNLSTFTGALAKNSDRIDGIIAGLERMTGGGAAGKPVVSFDLSIPADFAALETANTAPLAIGQPTALTVFDTQRFIVRSESGGRSPLQDNVQWADSIPKLVQVAMLHAFEKAVSPAMVSLADESNPAERRLLLDIRRFDLIASKEPVASIEVTARLVSENNRVIDARSFSAEALAASLDGADAAAAFNQAFVRLARDIVVWAGGVKQAPH
jgi:phospholipid/cholesterol/gamma-HCH transport system substrate-binding protein